MNDPIWKNQDATFWIPVSIFLIFPAAGWLLVITTLVLS